MKALSYKQKNRILLGASLAFCLIVYFLAIKKTVHVYSEYSALKKQVNEAEDLPVKIAMLEKQLQKLNASAGNGTEVNEQALLEIVTGYCSANNLILRDFPKTFNYRRKDMDIETNVFTVEGPFIKGLKMLYELERSPEAGKVSSVLFQKKEDIQTKRQYLTATVYVQYLKNSPNED
jgi:hypothetical protein